MVVELSEDVINGNTIIGNLNYIADELTEVLANLESIELPASYFDSLELLDSSNKRIVNSMALIEQIEKALGIKIDFAGE